VGLALHSLFDGLVITGAFEASNEIGARVAIALILHKFPDGFVLSSLLATSAFNAANSLLISPSPSSASGSSTDLGASGTSTIMGGSGGVGGVGGIGGSSLGNPTQQLIWGAPRRAWYWVLGVCSMTPVGAILGHLVFYDIPTQTLAFSLGFAAGSFIFISSTSIIPEILNMHGSNHHLSSRSQYISIIFIIAGYFGYILLEHFFHAH